MAVVARFQELYEQVAGWRREIHAHPELQFEVHRTARLVAERLREFGLDEVVEGIGRTGVVGVIKGRSERGGGVIGLRADMDALPIHEDSGRTYRSTCDGVMHACGHDGHTAMLLGAAKHLADTRAFDGRVVVIFQPAEEGGGGGREMVQDGMMERFGIQQVYGMHNWPGLPAGDFALRSGTLMASADMFTLELHALGGHAAKPHQCNDPIIVGAQIVQAFQTIVSRNADPVEGAVISVTQFTAGNSFNVIPQTLQMKGTVRTLDAALRDLVQRRMGELAHGIAQAFNVRAEFDYQRNYPTTVNHPKETEIAAQAAARVVGQGRVDANFAPSMGGEDFSFMLEARPGAFIFIGQGDTPGLHHPQYDFNDEVIPTGCSYWIKLVETALQASA